MNEAGRRMSGWRRMLPWLALALTVIVLDQITKVAIERAFAYNKGAAFSFLASASGWQDEFLTAVGLAASAFILYLLARHGHQRLFACALALILGGAIGNVIDRIAHGHVIDLGGAADPR